ncbi:hypothetical protein SEVIR_3G381500v4 [Setaria viridis]|uniref:Uncharacterized protein n=1 Tax=Setaria viridis TaxID=4556 RepID=A0A4U6VNE1_SETVI|nr:uncharacterized protein LOC117848866 [Setaria viridis]TKW29218.1 hypothetical protein SEVIR_3G381500v2 [Setaria viridis]TKW29219.1 hypothetical protein SEVIR_3G381500v2 [Setaria viridis]
MGTKVEGETYIPGYFDMADSSVNSNGNALPYYKENKPNVHLSDKFTITSQNGSVHYDKEMLKRTMLVHEATFRKQVYELHRLYRTQKEIMAQFQREEFKGCPRYAEALQPRSSASQILLEDVKRVRQTATPISGHDLKQSSINLINESSSQFSVSGAPLRHSNVRSQKKMLDLQLPADVYADDDDEVEILEVRPSKRSPWVSGSVLGRNVNLNLENSEGSSHVEKSWITDTQAHHSSAAHILNKPVEESSSMKITDFLGVGTSASQNQHYVSQGVNLNLLSSEGKLKEKCVGKISSSRFFGANEDIRHSNSFQQRKDDSNVNMGWYNQNRTGSSMGHYSPSARTFNHLIFAPPSFNHALNPPWQINSTSYLTKSHYGAAETSTAKHALSSGFSVDCTPNAPYHHSLKIHEEAQHRKLPPLHHNLKDIDLNDAPVDTAATWEQGSEKSMVDISWKQVSLMKSEVPSSYANCHYQILPSPTFNSQNKTPTRVPTFPNSVGTEKDSRCSPTLQYDLNVGPLIKCEPDMEMQPQREEADRDFRNLIDLNEPLPIMDDPEIDACESGELVPHESDDPLRDSLAITAAESLVAMCNVVVQPGSPQPDTLHWFADLAASKENTMFDKDSDDDFEALTLKLQETKSTEHHSTPRATQKDNCDNGHCSAASLLTPKPQRGKGRGRRKRKDFQRDILPCLALLPKHEVSEDLRALGRPKPVTPMKGGGRGGQQPRGRRRARSMAVAMEVEEVEVSPPPGLPPLAPADLDADALGITRWGRTTRRCRRPRCPPANNASLHVA